ncbi:pyridoxamine 5'-phosphate oxidase family protein [Streptomyces gilvifuscus]|uniref:Pyridoxamine 5'-phosphate oxidase family protein n=1 Tax=Streptomyces gilvifuscus TaxID=1550617 RepID=A0ABT5G0P9_9ACTN|nr:pyridoxamine 5'-phosphate oxidase family protein [Streptomyces gilvifuscus]MDC2958226.1 pyridoxamine 5'-phosphate oxidase family protein [Streptomyces gilvifuscus]
MTSELAAGVSGARMIELGRGECLALLAGVPLGRVGFTRQALPVIRPVNHLVDGDTVVIRTHPGSALARHTTVDEVVVYEADDLDARTRTGWSVMVTGRASLVTAPWEAARYRALLIPWTDRDVDEIVSIQADLVTGYRLLR